jgi:hypothetical protein
MKRTRSQSTPTLDEYLHWFNTVGSVGDPKNNLINRPECGNFECDKTFGHVWVYICNEFPDVPELDFRKQYCSKIIKYLTEQLELTEKQKALLHGFFVAWELYATHMKKIAILTQDAHQELRAQMTDLVKKIKL